LPTAAVVLVVVALLFSFLNGAKDGGNALATIITSRSMAPVRALIIVGIAEFAGPLLFGIAVARTIGSNVVDPGAVTINTVIAGLLGATAWNILTWRLGIPTSSSHALIGGLVGAVIICSSFNWGVLHAGGLLKIAAGLFAAPVIGMAGAYILMRAAVFLLRGASPHVNWFFKRSQIVTTLGLALSHGANDAPKSMGIITLGLVAGGMLPAFEVPQWVVLSSAASVALGTVLGSQGMIRSIGTRFYRVRPFHAFNSQVTSVAIVLLASLLGSPVSTGQVVSSAIVGVGAAERLTKVRWGVMEEMVAGWLFTIPATAIAGGLVYWLVSQWFGR
jgi:inorganic phosphate transporter, PiT family